MKCQKRGHFKPFKNIKAVVDIWCTEGDEEDALLFPGGTRKRLAKSFGIARCPTGGNQSVESEGPHTERYGASRESEILQEDEINDLLMRKRLD